MLNFPLKIDLPYQLSDMTPVKSCTFGRKIFFLQQQQKKYWIKYQALSGNEQYVAGFNREKEIYMWASHQAMTLPFWDIEIEPWIGSELSMGSTLLIPHAEPLLKFPPQHRDHAYHIIQQLITTVLVWHDLGWLHADLKPQHVVSYQNIPYLIDFEQMQKVDAVHVSLNATPHYMAPELFHHHHKSIQSDIYALGIIIYEWLSQKKLKANTYRDWAILHCQYSVFDLPPVYQEFQNLVNMMLHRNIDQRLKHLSLLKNL